MQGISLSPSFSSYSNSKIAEIAARIVGESDSDEFSGGGGSDEEFEFSIVPTDSEAPVPDSADEIFRNGEIRSVYPIFNRDLLLGHMDFHGGNVEQKGVQNSFSPKLRLPLRKLFLEERETTLTTSSSSSSESENLDGLTEESYCAWPPKSADLRSEKKSSSAGGKPRRSKLKDFLRRSNSDEIQKTVSESPAKHGKVKSAVPPPLYNWNGGDKQGPYLTKRQDLAGLFVA